MPPAYVWTNPLAVWGTATGNAQAPSIPVPDPRDTWRRNTKFKVQTYLVGRLRYFMILAAPRQPNLELHAVVANTTQSSQHQGTLQSKNRNSGKEDHRSPADLLAVLSMFVVAGPLLFPQSQTNALLTAGATFGIFAAINVCWTLIIGTASIFSLATYAVVGTAAFVTSLLSIRAGIPWFALPPIGAFIGLGFGILIAAPALRLDGFYYALLTLGLNELFRVFFTTSKQFGSASGGLYGAEFPSTKNGRHSPSRSSPTTLRWLC